MALARPSSPSSARAPPFSLLEFGNLVSAALDSPDPLLLSPFLSAPAHRSIDSNAHDEQKQMASHRTTDFDVKLTDSDGQHWIPRVKSSRARKGRN